MGAVEIQYLKNLDCAQKNPKYYSLKSSIISLFLFYAIQLQAQISDFEHIDFKKADSIAQSLHGEDLNNLSQLSYKLTSNLNTDVERFRAIYKWVCSNIKNDYGLYLRNNGQRQRFKDDSLKFADWNSTFRKKLFNKLRKKKRTICTGYAYLVKELATFANIECEMVQGYGRVSTTDIEKLTLPNHSWNAIKLEGKWYLCDPTWASGIPNPKTNRFTFQYNDGFFLPEPELFAVNHFPVEEKWWLFDGKYPTFTDFLAAPVLYGKAYEKLQVLEAPKAMHHNIKTLDSVEFKFQLKTLTNSAEIKLIIDSGVNQWKIKPTVVKINDKSLTIVHLFKKTGFYDVHLYIEEALVATYTVEVKH